MVPMFARADSGAITVHRRNDVVGKCYMNMRPLYQQNLSETLKAKPSHDERAKDYGHSQMRKPVSLTDLRSRRSSSVCLREKSIDSGSLDPPVVRFPLRMARAAVGWGVRDLAKQAGFTGNTVTRIENGADAKQSTMDALQRALEAASVEFTNGEQPGLRISMNGEQKSINREQTA